MKGEATVLSQWRSMLSRMMRRKEKPLGARGEEFAARYLKKNGMRIIARNRRARGGEIDLIGVEGKWVVFVEVRTLASESYQWPEDSIRFGKRRAVTRTVRRLLAKHKVEGMTARIDVVAVVWPAGAKEPTEVRHHKGSMAVARW